MFLSADTEHPKQFVVSGHGPELEPDKTYDIGINFSPGVDQSFHGASNGGTASSYLLDEATGEAAFTATFTYRLMRISTAGYARAGIWEHGADRTTTAPLGEIWVVFPVNP